RIGRHGFARGRAVGGGRGDEGYDDFACYRLNDVGAVLLGLEQIGGVEHEIDRQFGAAAARLLGGLVGTVFASRVGLVGDGVAELQRVRIEMHGDRLIEKQ